MPNSMWHQNFDIKICSQNIDTGICWPSTYLKASARSKVQRLEMLDGQKRPKGKLAFVGDGINNAPAAIQAGDESRKQHAWRLQTTVDSLLQMHNISATANVYAVNKEVKSHAYENHMAYAKYRAILELQQIDTTAI